MFNILDRLLKRSLKSRITYLCDQCYREITQDQKVFIIEGDIIHAKKKCLHDHWKSIHYQSRSLKKFPLKKALEIQRAREAAKNLLKVLAEKK